MPGLPETATAPVWLFDLYLAGRILRIAERRVSVPTADGGTLEYEAGLEPPDIGVVRAGGLSSTPVMIAGAPVEWAKIVAMGISVDGRRAEIRLWRPGTDYERAAVYARGETDGFTYGTAVESVRINVTADPERDALTLPDARAVVDDTTWPVRVDYEIANDKVVGVPYPIPIGYPGTGILGAEPDGAVPALYVEHKTSPPSGRDDRWIVGYGPVHAQQIKLWNFSTDPSDQTILAVETTNDALGRLVSYVEADIIGDGNEEFWAGFQIDAGWGGGVLSPYRVNEPIRGAGEIARWVLEEFTRVDVDRARMIAAQGWLDRFKVDTVIAERTNMWTWLNTVVLPDLPVIGVDGPRGFYLAPLRWDATPDQVVANIDTTMAHRDGRVATLGQPIYNQFTLEYRLQRDAAKYRSRRTLSAAGGDSLVPRTLGNTWPPSSLLYQPPQEDATAHGSAVCAWSQAQYDMREWIRTNDNLWDDATAALILEYKALQYAWPKRAVSYRGGYELESLLPGDVVTLTDPEVFFDRELALIVDRSTNGTEVSLDIVLIDHPLRRSLETG